MSLLTAVTEACPWLGITDVPDALFGSTTPTAIALRSVAAEAALGIVEDFDWQRLKTIATITGDGTTTEWDLPDDYSRMLKKAAIWPSEHPDSPFEHVTDLDEWLHREVRASGDLLGRWTIYDDKVHIKPAIASAQTAKYFYIKNTIISAEGSTTLTKTTFDADTDSFFLGDRILKLAIIWRYKAAKGRPYAEDFNNYSAARDQIAGGDKGSKVMHLGRARVPRDVSIAHPGVLGS